MYEMRVRSKYDISDCPRRIFIKRARISYDVVHVQIRALLTFSTDDGDVRSDSNKKKKQPTNQRQTAFDCYYLFRI